MAGHTKVLNHYVFASVKSVFFLVLLSTLPRISHQSTGKKCVIFYFINESPQKSEIVAYFAWADTKSILYWLMSNWIMKKRNTKEICLSMNIKIRPLAGSWF